MRVETIKIGATIPTGQYANIQPEIVLSEVTPAEGMKFGMDFIKSLYAKYSVAGLTEKELALTVLATKKSFNEDIAINFDPLPHTYHYDGKKLISATEYIKKFYKPFDSETISAVSGKAWGVPQDEVKDMWQIGGELTSDFGTLGHKALEFYENHKEAGAKISKAKGLDYNYAIPSHPILKKIVEEFIAIDRSKGKITTEALITDIKKGFCGHADRIEIIDEKKKICRIGDYKFNINADEIDPKRNKVLTPFEHLPSNKLSKYQLQMSFYANMLESSGWTVVGLDVYVYEDKWVYYPLEVLKVI